MNNTPLTELYEWLRIETWGFEEPCESGREPIDILVLEQKLKELLPKEKEVIVTAFEDGGKKEWTLTTDSGEDYYNLTFNTQE